MTERIPFDWIEYGENGLDTCASSGFSDTHSGGGKDPPERQRLSLEKYSRNTNNSRIFYFLGLGSVFLAPAGRQAGRQAGR